MRDLSASKDCLFVKASAIDTAKAVSKSHLQVIVHGYVHSSIAVFLDCDRLRMISGMFHRGRLSHRDIVRECTVVAVR